MPASCRNVVLTFSVVLASVTAFCRQESTTASGKIECSLSAGSSAENGYHETFSTRSMQFRPLDSKQVGHIRSTKPVRVFGASGHLKAVEFYAEKGPPPKDGECSAMIGCMVELH